MSVQRDLLKEVAEIVGGERSKDYGPPSLNLDHRTARLWQVYQELLDPFSEKNLDGIDVCMMMILVKMARIMQDKSVKDNYADIAGYAAAAWEIEHG
jgi:hypothetical protein